jgi:hypothetical protein
LRSSRSFGRLATPLDELDPLITLARDVIRGYPNATCRNGVRQAPAAVTIAANPCAARSSSLDVTIEVETMARLFIKDASIRL